MHVFLGHTSDKLMTGPLIVPLEIPRGLAAEVDRSCADVADYLAFLAPTWRSTSEHVLAIHSANRADYDSAVQTIDHVSDSGSHGRDTYRL
jgi:hypothetical protein